MKIKKALRYLEKTYKIGRKLGLENMKILMRKLDNPERKLKVIHVAGTNGKGSTCSMIYHVLLAAGYRVGFYSSPHLYRYNERFQMDGREITDEQLATEIDRMKAIADEMVREGHPHPTEFELLTALALDFFHRQGCEILVSEVGLGGRLDATNIVEQPIACVITPIAFDHQFYLGNSLAAIAGEKGGIIKDRVPLFLSEQEPEARDVLLDLAKKHDAPLREVDLNQLEKVESDLQGSRFRYKNQDYALQLIGEYQVHNAATAIETLSFLRERGTLSISQEDLREGLWNTRWIGRIEKIHSKPDIYVDGSHNPHGARTLSKTFQQHCQDHRCIAVFAMKDDKDVKGVLDEVSSLFSHWILTLPSGVDGIPIEKLKAFLPKDASVEEESDLRKAMQKARAMATEEDTIIGFGSFYLIGDLREEVLKDA